MFQTFNVEVKKWHISTTVLLIFVLKLPWGGCSATAEILAFRNVKCSLVLKLNRSFELIKVIGVVHVLWLKRFRVSVWENEASILTELVDSEFIPVIKLCYLITVWNREIRVCKARCQFILIFPKKTGDRIFWPTPYRPLLTIIPLLTIRALKFLQAKYALSKCYWWM